MSNTNKDKRKRIAIFSSNDNVWGLPAMSDTISKLIKEQHDVVGIFLFPERLANMQGIRVMLWRLKIFGLWNCFVMGIYALKVLLKQLRSPIGNWDKLSEKYGLQLNYASSPNAENVIKWTKENNIDIILIMVGNILKKEIINAPNIGIINKHAAILPACKGLFPFFWAKLKNLPLGFTFHQVDTGIDTGKILIQVNYPEKDSNISMLRFYIDVFALYPEIVGLAVNKFIDNEYLKPSETIESHYYSLPAKSDYKEFRKRAFQVANFSDIFYHPSINVGEIINEIRGDKY